MDIPVLQMLSEEETRKSLEAHKVWVEQTIDAFVDHIYEKLYGDKNLDEPYRTMNKQVIRIEFERFRQPPPLEEAMRQYAEFKLAPKKDPFDEMLERFFEDAYQRLYAGQHHDTATKKAILEQFQKDFENCGNPNSSPEAVMMDFWESKFGPDSYPPR